MINNMVRENILILMEIFIKEIGKMVSKMELVRKSWWMELYIKGIFKMVQNVE